MDDSMKWELKWDLGQDAFFDLINGYIQQAVKEGKVFPLCWPIGDANEVISQMTVLLSQVNCDNCSAICCRHNPDNAPLPLLPQEYQRLADKYGSKYFHQQDGKMVINMPCPFLLLPSPVFPFPMVATKEKGNHLCSVYPDRPINCVIYPFQLGANDAEDKMIISMDSTCPEARRITLLFYLTAWQLRQKFRQLGQNLFLKSLF